MPEKRTTGIPLGFQSIRLYFTKRKIHERTIQERLDNDPDNRVVAKARVSHSGVLMLSGQISEEIQALYDL
jgi:hypothetical protein